MADPGAPRRPHFGRHAAIRFQSAANGEARFACDVQDFHLNPNGIVHGGVTYTMVDQAMGAALYSQLAPGESASTLEIKINYLRAAKAGQLICDGWVVERQGRVATLEAEVTSQDGDVLIAKALGSYMVSGLKTPNHTLAGEQVSAAGSQASSEKIVPRPAES